MVGGRYAKTTPRVALIIESTPTMSLPGSTYSSREYLEQAVAVLTLSWPVALASLSSPAMQVVDVCVVAKVLGAASVAGCTLGLLAANILLEPSCFVLTNAVTTLCAGCSPLLHMEKIGAHLRGAAAFSAVLALPMVALLLSTPFLLSTSLPADVGDAVLSYAPWYALNVLPSLLLAALVGLLRAQGKLRYTALLCAALVPVNLLAAWLLVPAYGLAGSALGAAATRTFGVLALVVHHRDSLGLCSTPAPPTIVASDSTSFGMAAELAAAPRRAPPPSPTEALVALSRHYAHSLLPATLRTGLQNLLTVIALVLGGPVEAASFAVCALLLQALHALCMGVQQATLMLISRHLGQARRDAARGVMRVAGALVVALAIVAGLLGALGQSGLDHLAANDALSTSTAELSLSLARLAPYLAPLLLLKSLSGIYGGFLAVTARGYIGTWVLVSAQAVLGLPFAWIWAAHATHFYRHGATPSAHHGQPAALALVQAHLGSWLVSTASFVAVYLIIPTAAPSAAVMAGEAPRNGSARAIRPSAAREADSSTRPPERRPGPGRPAAGRSGGQESLARPLLEAGRPAP